MPVPVYLGLGSNPGDGQGHLDRGLAALCARVERGAGPVPAP